MKMEEVKYDHFLKNKLTNIDMKVKLYISIYMNTKKFKKEGI